MLTESHLKCPLIRLECALTNPAIESLLSWASNCYNEIGARDENILR